MQAWDPLASLRLLVARGELALSKSLMVGVAVEAALCIGEPVFHGNCRDTLGKVQHIRDFARCRNLRGLAALSLPYTGEGQRRCSLPRRPGLTCRHHLSC